MSVKNKSYIYVFFANFFKIILRIVFFPFVLIYLIKNLAEKKKNKEKIAVFSMAQIDSLSGVDFENFLCEMFEKLGYNVTKTKASHDYGADLLISKKGKLSVVQAKCYAGAVGIKAIQETISAKHHYGAQDAICATNRTFSKDAEVLALETGVALLDRTVIEQMLQKYQFNIEKTYQGFMATSQKAETEINQRFKHMI